MFTERNLGGSIQQKTGTQTLWIHKVAYHYVYFTLFYAEFRKIGRDVHLDHFAKKEYCRKQRETGRFLTNQKVTYKGGNFCLTKKNFLPN